MPNRKKSKKKEKEEEEELEALRKEVEEERREKAEVEWVANELGKCVDEMEKNVHQLESGNYDFDDSEIKQRYDNQRQLNIQLLEQKHWLEHELEEIKLKIQNDKLSFLPDPFMMDWDNLSETELKRLVLQLEKTKADVILDLRDAQLHLDHEGREFFHFDHFCQVYRTEILNLNRTLDSLMRHGALPTGYTISSFNSILSSNNSSYASTGAQTPNAPVSPKKIQHSPRKSAPLSPRRMPPVVRQRSSPSGGRSSETMSAGAATARQVSPKKKPKTPKVVTSQEPPKSQKPNGRTMDPKMGPARKTAGVRNLPKLERKPNPAPVKETKPRRYSNNDSDSDDGDLESLSNFLSGPPLPTPMGSRRSASNMLDLSELDPVKEMTGETSEESS